MDHGRAEAMLIAAWGLGLRLKQSADAAEPSAATPTDVDEPDSEPGCSQLDALAAHDHDHAWDVPCMGPVLEAFSGLPVEPGVVLLNGTALQDAIKKRKSHRLVAA